MELIINGENRPTPDLATLQDLAAWLELPAFGSAIELNGEVIRKAMYFQTSLSSGDRLEIVRLVGGG
ncbi:MAG: sulfur carrier protein ThiS [Holophaga sp.]|nr:sulfur carrier protein ThiS [Holophaga sp.]